MLLTLQSEEYNWDFETGDLSCWQAEGLAFINQPIRGDRITTARVHPVTLGGDYWDVPIAIGHHGNYWVGSAENPLGDAATGSLTSCEFPINHRYIHFLISGTRDIHTVRVELQLRQEQYRSIYRHAAGQTQLRKITSLVDPASLERDEDFVIWCKTTGHNSEVMRGESWDLAELVDAGRSAVV